MFPKYTFCDLTGEIEKISKTFEELDIGFDAIYTGYLGSFEQLALVSDMFDRNGGKDCTVLIDPVMADNGKLYKGFTSEFAKAMAKLCSKADIIVPNLTEACFMLDIPYSESYTEDYVRDVLKKLTGLGAKVAALTGISFEEGKLGVYAYDSEADRYFQYYNDRLPVSYHGTGDIFASSALGALMRGHTVESALRVAVDFTLECIKNTVADGGRRFYGVNFEESLPYYIKRLEEKL